mgnify:CR=1 FL=1
MVPKSDHLANPRFDKKPSAQVITVSYTHLTLPTTYGV